MLDELLGWGWFLSPAYAKLPDFSGKQGICLPGLAATGIYFQVFCEALLAMLRFSIVVLYCVVVFVRVPPQLSIILMTGDSSAHLPASDIAYWNCRAGIPSVIQTGISVSLFLPLIIIETFTSILLLRRLPKVGKAGLFSACERLYDCVNADIRHLTRGPG